MISVHSRSFPAHLHVRKWDSNHLTSCFITLLIFENQVSNILRHSHLNQQHLDCLWSWTSLHSFLLQVFPNLALCYIYTESEKSEGKDHLSSTWWLYCCCFLVCWWCLPDVCIWKRWNSFCDSQIHNRQALVLSLGRSPVRHSWEGNYTGTTETNLRSKTAEKSIQTRCRNKADECRFQEPKWTSPRTESSQSVRTAVGFQQRQ